MELYRLYSKDESFKAAIKQTIKQYLNVSN